MEGAPRWFLAKWFLSKLHHLAPFHDAVNRARENWKKPNPPTPNDLAFEAMSVLLTPLDAAFGIAYSLLALGALLFWMLPFLVTGWS